MMKSSPKLADEISAIKPLPSVTTITVLPQEKQVKLYSRGTVVSSKAVTIVPEVSGKINWVSPNWVNGGVFRAGETLLTVEKQKYQHQLAQAQANLASAESQLMQEQAQAYVAKKDWEGLINKENKAAAKLALREPQIAYAEAQVLAAETNLKVAQQDLAKTAIKAPFTGILSKKNSDIGQFISATQQLGQFHGIDSIEIRVPINHRQLSLLSLPQIGQSVALLVLVTKQIDDTVYSWQGNLIRTEGVVDQNNRVLFAVVKVNDPYGLETLSAHPLRIGTFVNIEIVSKPIANIVKLPRKLLRAGNHLWLVNSANQLEKRQVLLLPTKGDDAYVASGLKANDRVVTSPMADPVEGREVLIENVTPTMAGTR